MFGREMKKVTIDVQEQQTEHYVDAFGVVSAISEAMQRQGIKECCRATVEHEDGDNDLLIGVKKVATVGLEWNARGKQ
jgi:formylmethanofuran dehydrogenase subunit D